MTPVIFGCADTVLSKDEKHFMRDANPWAYILFARNVESPLQVQRLVGDLKDAIGRDAAVLIDQEGGRVARLKAPHWQEWTPVGEMIAEAGGKSIDLREAEIAQRLLDRYCAIGQTLRNLGIDVNCVPLLDVPQPGADNIIGDRALGKNPDYVADRAKAVIAGCQAGGVAHIIKHIPGHGRAMVDSHLELPVVPVEREELEVDFAPFRVFADAPMAMTAHVTYTAIDPENCATCSPDVIRLIREDIGFQGLLMTDDLSMQALQGSFADRMRQALRAGCDVILHCNGKRDEMEAILSEVSEFSDAARKRAGAVDTYRASLSQNPEPIDPTRLRAAGLKELAGV